MTMIDILKHNFQNRSSGFNLAPVVAAAAPSLLSTLAPSLIAGGSGILGGVMSGMGGGKVTEKDRADKMSMFNTQLEENRIDRQINKQQTDRAQNMSGIGMLADMRSSASQRTRHQAFKDALYRTVGGA